MLRVGLTGLDRRRKSFVTGVLPNSGCRVLDADQPHEQSLRKTLPDYGRYQAFDQIYYSEDGSLDRKDSLILYLRMRASVSS